MKELTILLASLFFVSCGDFVPQANVFFVDPETGAKAGLSSDGNTVTVDGRIVDADGNVIGGGSVTFPVVRSEK